MLSSFVRSTAYILAVVDSIAIITTSAVAPTAIVVIVFIIQAALNSKDRGESDDQGKCSQDVVDNSGNVAADSNSMEGPGSVPLFS